MSTDPTTVLNNIIEKIDKYALSQTKPNDLTSQWVGRNKAFRAQARISVSGKLPETPPRATLGWSYSGLPGSVPKVYLW